MNYWLMKSEPDAFGIDDLKSRPRKTEHWDGIRNYQARNFIRDDMKKGDLAFFYHSNCKQPGIVGITQIVREAYPDHTAFDAGSKYFDARSDPDNPRWFMVEIKYKRHLKRLISLAELKANASKFGDFQLLKRGNRLSILPMTRKQWDQVLKLEEKKPL